MAIPVYLWLKDDGGADIKSSVDLQDRKGSIEITKTATSFTRIRGIRERQRNPH